MISAFGIEHGEISKADQATKDRRTANTLAGMGATSAGLGAATAGIGYAEHKGKDPMGFIHTWGQQLGKRPSAGARAHVLRAVARGHGVQAAAAGGLGATSLGLSHAYRKKSKQNPVSKAVKEKDASLRAGTAAVGGTAAGLGGYNAQFLGGHVAEHQKKFRAAHHLVALHNMNEVELPAKELKETLKTRRISGRVAGIKGAGAVASAGIAGAGAKVAYDAIRGPKKAKVGKGLNPKNMEALDRTGRRLAGTPAGDYANAKLALRLSGRSRARDAGGRAWNKKTMAMTLKPLEKRPLP